MQSSELQQRQQRHLAVAWTSGETHQARRLVDSSNIKLPTPLARLLWHMLHVLKEKSESYWSSLILGALELLAGGVHSSGFAAPTI